MIRPVQWTALLATFLLCAPAAFAAAWDAPEVAPEPVPQPLMLDISQHLAEFEAALLEEKQQHAPVPAYSTGIGPGSLLVMSMGGGLYICTANFVWTDGTKYYLGAAGHCFVPPGKTSTHDPGKDYEASSTAVAVCIDLCLTGGTASAFFRGNVVGLGQVAYARASQGGDAIGNDFGIVEIPSHRENLIRTTLPVWGGPTPGTTAVSAGVFLCHYGRGTGVGEVFPTMARMGVGISQSASAGEWWGSLAAEPGDSGSAVVTCGPDADGWHGKHAVGILTHGTGVPIVGIGGGITYGTLVAKAISMTSSQAGISLSLVYTYP